MLPRCSTGHRRLGLLVLVFLTAEVASGPRYSSRIVEIQTGAIRGVILELNSRHLEPVEVFRGVPYAAPPVGPLRFLPPRPPLPWPGTRLADSFGAVCPQKYPDVSNRTAALQSMPKGRYQHLRKLIPLLANQSEDCLFLNIYVPGSGNRGLEAPYAVLVFVHGESFEWGAGHPYDGSVLASYGHVIVVTLNYRLGILGFLRTRGSAAKGGEPSGGNLGIKDIAAALRWIKSNVGAFGGDPTRVTLVGHDTGAALVNLLFVSPNSKGLFRRVVLLSGSALSPWATIHNPESLRISVGRQTGCLPADSEDDTSDIAHCLRSRPLQALLDLRLETVRFMPRVAPSLPVDAESSDPAFAMEHASENFITCEVMLGTTTTESYGDFNANDIQYGFEEDQRNRVLRTYIRNAYVYHLNEIFSAVRNEYTDWDKSIQHPINIRDSTMEALSDGHTVSPLVRVAYLHARRGAKTYFFHFGYQTKESDYPQRLGSVRGEDLTYILGLPLVGGQPNFPQNFTRQDMGVAEAVLNFFSNFAKSGDPNVGAGLAAKDIPDYGTPREKTRYKGLTWEPYEIGTQSYLSITLKPKMKSHYRGHKMAVWLNLIPQLHQPGDEDVSMRHHHFHEREPHFYAGLDVDSINTVQFSNHPKYGTIKGKALEPEDFVDLTDGLRSNGIDDYSYLLTGYVRSPALLRLICSLVRSSRERDPRTVYVCDPVMGDEGRLYVPEELVSIYREEVLPLTSIITPNLFEAELLTGVEIRDVETAWRAVDSLHEKGCRVAVITSVTFPGDENIMVLASSTEGGSRQKLSIEVKRFPVACGGTGDLFTALFLAWMHKTSDDLKESLERSVATVHAVLERTMAHLEGAVRAESFTRLPSPLHPASMTDSHLSAGGVSTECIPEPTAGNSQQGESDDEELDEESEEILQRLATRHYYSYTAALGVTVGVGCLLLVLNMLIFAGIYYQRERDRKRQEEQQRARNSRSNSTPSTETIPMSQRPSTPGSSARQSPVNGTKRERLDPPPSYAVVSTAAGREQQPPQGGTLKRERPPPPVRTSSNPSAAPPAGGTVKKRVQIQEISV